MSLTGLLAVVVFAVVAWQSRRTLAVRGARACPRAPSRALCWTACAAGPSPRRGAVRGQGGRGAKEFCARLVHGGVSATRASSGRHGAGLGGVGCERH